MPKDQYWSVGIGAATCHMEYRQIQDFLRFRNVFDALMALDLERRQ
jgi:hypothetical protein